MDPKQRLDGQVEPSAEAQADPAVFAVPPILAPPPPTLFDRAETITYAFALVLTYGLMVYTGLGILFEAPL